jgi:hypothetical protein
MAKISSYVSDTALTTGDKVLGTDVSGVTRNYTLGQLGTFVQDSYTLDLSNGVNNRLITSTDADSLSGEANLTFDGSTLILTGDQTASGDVDVTGSVKVVQNLRRTVTTVTVSGSTYTCDLSLNDNFKFTVANAASQTIALTVATENIGQSGNIIITNPSSVGSLAFAALPAYMKTPSGATVNFDTTANKIAVISYIVLATDTVLVNYIGDFS